MASSKVPERRLEPDVAVQSFNEVLLGYEPEAAVAEARRGAGLDYSTATQNCPYGIDLDALVHALAKGDVDGAAGVVRRSHPWGSVLGRCCHRFCEAAMAKSYPAGFEPVNLRALERAAADYGTYEPVAVESPPSGKRVAVVGAGSGGVATALELLRLGHQVTLFDALDEVGGMFIVGYPNFRMPREVVRRELLIQSPLLQLRLGRSVDRSMMDGLLTEYDAVCLAFGFFQAAQVAIPGDDLAGVYEGLDFLRRVSLGQSVEIGSRVAVLGAGYSAQDAARTARRLGAKEVLVAYRRGPDEMPIRPAVRRSLLQMMEEEGIVYHFFVNPLRVVGKEGRTIGLECQRMRPGELDESGRPRPEPADEAPFTLPVDNVIKCLGQGADFSILPKDVRVDGPLIVNVERKASRKGLFVVGDIAGDMGNDGAFAGGREVAQEIHRYLVVPDFAWPRIEQSKQAVRQRPGVALGGG